MTALVAALRPMAGCTCSTGRSTACAAPGASPAKSARPTPGRRRVSGDPARPVRRTAEAANPPARPAAGRLRSGAMHAACAPFADAGITPMAAVAGAVADHVLAAMTRGRTLERPTSTTAAISLPGACGEACGAGWSRDLAAPALDGRFELLGKNPRAAGDVRPGLQGARRAQLFVRHRRRGQHPRRDGRAGRRRRDHRRQRRRPARPSRRRPPRGREIDPDSELGAGKSPGMSAS